MQRCSVLMRVSDFTQENLQKGTMVYLALQGQFSAHLFNHSAAERKSLPGSVLCRLSTEYAFRRTKS